MEQQIDKKRVMQLGLIVRNLDETKRRMATFLGVEVPPTVGCGDYAVTHTEYLGQPAPEAACEMAFFDLDNLQIELIQPGDKPSVWRDYLEQKGEGLHHIAMAAKNIPAAGKALEAAGMPLLQAGEYGDASGRYAYYDAGDSLKLVLELLESYDK